MRCLACFAWIIAAWLAAAPAVAAERAPDRVLVLTMSPGDHPFARFGHNAIVLEWASERRALVYNFGTFAFDGMEGVRDFMAGRFRYWLSVSTLSRTLRAYSAQNRSVVAQELALDAGERMRLAAALDENARPENRFYDYDYYYDNCSTRVRDVVDRAIGGELARSVRGPGRLTFREHTERLTADVLGLYFGLDLALGPLTDRPTTRWNELFIPGELQAALATARRRVDGAETALVRSERLLVRAARGPPRRDPPSRALVFLAVGCALGGALAAIGHAGRRSRVARVGFAAATSLVALLLGLLGSVFAFFWAFTKHWAAHRNANLLVCTPWAIIVAISVWSLVAPRSRGAKLTRRLVALSAATSIVALVLALIPNFGQDNTRTAALFAPLWFGIFYGVRALLPDDLVAERRTGRPDLEAQGAAVD